MESVWAPCPGARSTSFIESLALLAAGSIMPIACYQIMFSFPYICIYLFMSAGVCFTVFLAYDIFTLPTAYIVTITCLLPSKLKAELTCTVPMRALLWSNSCNPRTTCVLISERKYFHLLTARYWVIAYVTAVPKVNECVATPFELSPTKYERSKSEG